MKPLTFLLLMAVAFRAQSQTYERAESVASFLMQQASGTSSNPGDEHHGPMFDLGRWRLMAHGIVLFNDIRESGPRGGNKNFSTNWGMLSAHRPLGGGHLMLRTMLSLEPATITGRKYPELFQTGETAFGKQIIDGQHPHDFFMEFAAEYARSFGMRGMAFVYVAPVGDPALGPVAFPHRDSAMELPQAPVGHHLEDSTHISYNVITTGVVAGPATLEASAFHGGEPDEQRWNIDGGRINSWAMRLQLRPASGLNLQVSHGRLTKPEKIEPGYATRTTASASSNLKLSFGEWSSTIVFGRVYKEVHDHTLDAWLGEMTLRFLGRNHLTIRAESVDKDELFPHPILTVVPRPPLPVRVFRVQAYTLGYTFDILRAATTTTGVGANVTRYAFPPILDGFYGTHPHSVIVYVRVRLGGDGSHHHHMDMPM